MVAGHLQQQRPFTWTSHLLDSHAITPPMCEMHIHPVTKRHTGRGSSFCKATGNTLRDDQTDTHIEGTCCCPVGNTRMQTLCVCWLCGPRNQASYTYVQVTTDKTQHNKSTHPGVDQVEKLGVRGQGAKAEALPREQTSKVYKGLQRPVEPGMDQALKQHMAVKCLRRTGQLLLSFPCKQSGQRHPDTGSATITKATSPAT